MCLGWVKDHFIDAKMHFKYYGFEWVQVLPPFWMYFLHGLMLIAAAGIMLGAFYRVSAVVFFLCFTYIELIDLTYYLNHYYFVSIIAFLLIFVPANRLVSIDRWRDNSLKTNIVPAWTITIFKLQLAIVYIYAGLIKINYDWLFNALPLKIWLPAADNLPIIGWLMKYEITPYLFSWMGMLYDTTIIFWLIWSKSRPLAYLSVIIFHVLTGILFQIGVFPLVMIGATLIFFSATWHERIYNYFGNIFQTKYQLSSYKTNKYTLPFFCIYFAFQFLFPWRFLLYKGNMFWTEQGYRFGWRVMLMEKAGTATFYVKDGAIGREGEVLNSDFLAIHQEKQMAMQPDMILQYAHFLKNTYEQKGVAEPAVRAEVFVTLNGKPSKLLFDPNLDLTKIRDNWSEKTWLNDFDNK